MFSKLRCHLSYANVVGSLALFVALGGTSFAVATGSIGSREIKNNSVRSKDIRKAAILSSDVKNGTLLPADFRAGQLPQGDRGPMGPTGPRGATGRQGPRGLQGIQGENGDISTLQTVEGAPVALDTTTPTSATVACPDGPPALFPTGGGYRKGSGGGVIFAFASEPVDDAGDPDAARDSWRVTATSNAGGTTIVPIAICARASSPSG